MKERQKELKRDRAERMIETRRGLVNDSENEKEKKRIIE